MTRSESPSIVDTHPGTKDRVPGLDGLRGIAISLVIVSHALDSPGVPVSLDYLKKIVGAANLGSLGVRLFFVISGFIITHLLLTEEARHGRINLGRFWVRRGLRIFPPLYGYLAVLVLISWTTPAIQVHPPELLAAATLTGGLFTPLNWWVGHTWTLAIEEQFYLLWPLICFLPGRLRWGILLILTVLVMPVWVVWLMASAPKIALWIFPSNFVYLSAGCFLAGLRRYRCEPLAQLPAMGTLFLGAIIYLAAELLSHRHTPLIPLTMMVQAASLGMIVAISIHERPAWWSNFQNQRWLVSAGLLSYSLYLWQQLFLGPFGKHWWQGFPQNLGFVWIAAWLSHQVLERPFMAWRQRFRPQ